ncbi:hypothetical protein [Methylobacterium sp. R2-1]|uniref:hypothetical protein n=1 Tax=Methylobacterium sp. R2-1 TaxID=2587064 RepID=UPI00183094CA|nr:hypothetical protein [Methylobacterium sp. R2-1]MBB2959907.1 hypothetical protein [Methylobacterium sp. R2-1]
MADLFNLERALTPSERRHLRGGTQAKGYAAMPGTGPKGETCGSCDHLVRKRLAKVYRKCGLMERHWTGGKGTDVLTTAPACRNWKAPASRKDLSGQNVSLAKIRQCSGNAVATDAERLTPSEIEGGRP